MFIILILTIGCVGGVEVDKLQKQIIINESNHENMKRIVEKQSINSVKVIKAKVTAYAPHDNKSGICNDGTPNTTATGTYPKVGIVAVDPRKIPYGTEMHIPGYGYAIAEDTGSALREYNGIQIDVVMNSYEEAIQWGVKYVDVTLEV